MAEKKPPHYVDFSLANGVSPDEIAADMRSMRAMISLINVSNTYYASPEGSEVEAQAYEMLDRMVTDLVNHPEKAGEIIANLLTVVTFVSMGQGTVGEYLEGFGFTESLIAIDKEQKDD